MRYIYFVCYQAHYNGIGDSGQLEYWFTEPITTIAHIRLICSYIAELSRKGEPFTREIPEGNIMVTFYALLRTEP